MATVSDYCGDGASESSCHGAYIFGRVRRPGIFGISIDADDLHGGGLLHGRVGGGAIVLLGSVFGGLSAFLFYRKHFRRLRGPLNQQSARNIWLTLIGLRLSPIVPAPLVNFFSAAFHVSPVQYLTTSLMGSAPLVLLYSQIGQQGHQFLSDGTLYWRQFSGYLVILTLSTLLSLLGPWRSVLNEFKQLKGSYGSETLPLQPDLGRNP